MISSKDQYRYNKTLVRTLELQRDPALHIILCIWWSAINITLADLLANLIQGLVNTEDTFIKLWIIRFLPISILMRTMMILPWVYIYIYTVVKINQILQSFIKFPYLKFVPLEFQKLKNTCIYTN